MSNKPIEISKEARELVLKLHVEAQNHDDLRRAKWHEDYLWHKGINLAICAKEIQLAINSATEKLTAENERLREALGKAIDVLVKEIPDEIGLWEEVRQNYQLPTTPNQGEQKR